jgi:hypothetical protein
MEESSRLGHYGGTFSQANPGAGTKKACLPEKGNRLLGFYKKACTACKQTVFLSTSLFLRQPGCPLRTRGFVPPDLSEFTFSETVNIAHQISNIINERHSILVH